MTTSLYTKYFVLKPAGTSVAARASRNAMRAFAQTVRAHGQAEFANQICEWVEHESVAAIEAALFESASTNDIIEDLEAIHKNFLSLTHDSKCAPVIQQAIDELKKLSKAN